MKPRPYQGQCVHAIRDAWLRHRSVLAILATGLGKANIIGYVCQAEPQQRILAMAHREELVTDLAERIGRITGERVGVEMAESRSTLAERIVSASVQTISRPDRLARFAKDRFGIVIVDEAHHSVAKSYRNVLDHFCGAKVLGTTATPKRSDELAMGQVFESVAFDFSLPDAIDRGYLVPVKQYAVNVEGLDLSSLKTVAGDFSEAELEAILTEEGPLHQMALPALEIAGDRQGIFFCSGVKHAQLMSSIINRHKPGSSMWLCGDEQKTSKEARRHWVGKFKAGDLQWLCNCGLFLEGFDAPANAVVAMGRLTKSMSLYAQMLGRGTRPLPGLIDSAELWPDEMNDQRRDAIASSVKPHCIAIDFVGNAGKHKIVSSLDILGGKYGEPVRQYAKKTIAEEGKGAPTDEALERAAIELDLLNEEDDRRRKIKARSVQYDAREVSPFENDGGGGTGGQQFREAPTPGQVNYLVYRAGWSRTSAESLSKGQASAIIGKHKSQTGAA